MNSMNLIPTYKVYKVSRKNGKKILISRGHTEAEAQRIVQSYPSMEFMMIVYTKDTISKWKKNDSPV